jgi:curved DNA-binding protein CbpA
MPFLLRLITILLATVLTNSSPFAPPSNTATKPFRSNPYEILGVPATATQKEIQQQYRFLCLRHHPNKKRTHNDNDGKTGVENDFAFKEIQHAYSLIGTEGDRRKYDTASKWNRFST